MHKKAMEPQSTREISIDLYQPIAHAHAFSSSQCLWICKVREVKVMHLEKTTSEWGQVAE